MKCTFRRKNQSYNEWPLKALRGEATLSHSVTYNLNRLMLFFRTKEGFDRERSRPLP